MKGVFVTLIRREFWENKSLWVAPLAAAALFIGGAIFLNYRSVEFFARLDDKARVGRLLSEASITTTATFIGLVTGLALFAYLLDCLNAERRDRSILFWKSLPVSDAQTVLAKVVTATLVVSLAVIPLIFLIQPIIMLINWVRYESLRPYINIDMLAAWPTMLARIGLMWAFGILWYAPVATWLMLASVLAKRAPLAYAVLPPLVLVAGERLMLESTHITQFVVERFFHWVTRHIPPAAPPGAPGVTGTSTYIEMYIDTRWWVPFQDPALWIGLAVAAGMLYIVIRLRRYRDDT